MATLGPVRPVHDDPLRSGVERYFEYSLFAMVVTGFVTLAGTGKLDPFSLLFVLAALGFRAYHLATGQKLVLTVQTTTRLTIAYSFFYVLDFFLLSASFITATVHLVLFVMVVKMFSAERQRDDVYLAVISFMLILSAAILTVDSFFMISFTVFLMLTVTTFITMEMRRSFQATESPDPQADSLSTAVGSHISTAGLSPSQRLARSLSGSAVVLVTTIVIGAVVIFFVLPRVSTGYLSAFASRNAYVSGFGDSVQLGEIGQIQQSDDVVMHVQFPGGVTPPPDLKFRGVGLDKFDGRRWTAEPWAVSVRGPGLNFQSSEWHGRLTGLRTFPPRSSGDVLTYRVLLEPIGVNAFFLVQTPLTLASDVRSYGIQKNGTVVSTDPVRQARIYSGTSLLRHPYPTAAGQTSDATPNFLKNYLELPELDPRIAKLAQEVTRNQSTTFAKAAAIESFLQNNFDYTLQMYTAAGEDPLAYFLFTRKQGHCEYFATSMAVMLRTLGIPTRIVNGFRNGELNDITGSYIVRARNAHSWVEVFIPGFGWATFEPTPAAELEPVTGWSRTMLYIDAMREFWSEWVINYDFNQQNNLSITTISKGRFAFDETRIWLRDKYEKLLQSLKRTEQSAKSNPRRLGTRVVLLLVAVLLLLNLRRMVRAYRESRLAAKPARAPGSAATIWYMRLTRALGKRGLLKKPSQTPAEFVSSIPKEPLKHRVADFTRHYERARFGGSSEDAEKLPELFEEVVSTFRE